MIQFMIIENFKHKNINPEKQSRFPPILIRHPLQIDRLISASRSQPIEQDAAHPCLCNIVIAFSDKAGGQLRPRLDPAKQVLRYRQSQADASVQLPGPAPEGSPAVHEVWC